MNPSFRPPASACPSLFRLAAARDGGICRVKLPLGRISAAQAETVADAADRFGNGVIELTSRANLQIRGVNAGGNEDLVRLMLSAGLGPKDPLADDIRNVMASPLAGIDSAQLLDSAELGTRVLALLESDSRLHALSPKFSIQIDGGETLAQTRHPADLWLAAISQDEVALGLAGPLAVEADDAPALATIPVAQALAVVEVVLLMFAAEAQRDAEITRMRHLLAKCGQAGVLAEIEARLGTPLETARALSWRRPRPRENGHLGSGLQRDGRAFVGARPALGRIDPACLRKVAALARRWGSGVLHLTPWQSLILPGIRLEDAEPLLLQLQESGFWIDPAEPLSTMVACSGSVGCRSGLADTQVDALALADAMPLGKGIHLTGCPKSCALAHVAPITLVGTAGGRYDVFARAKGEASRFGRRIAGDVALGDIPALIQNLP